MKKAILGLLAWGLPFFLIAQNNASTQSIVTKDRPGMKNENGINWAEGLTWEQVKRKAKEENKYIFVDAYTTWCGPCKMMDKYVYPNDTISSFLNEHFISVKAQMDVTDSDSKSIKDWYNDATIIRTEYMVNAYPSLIFLTPEGKIIQKKEGYFPKEKFVSIADSVLSPGTLFNDPYKEYKMLRAEYDKGVMQYEKMPYMIKTAMNSGDKDLVKRLSKDYENYWLADSNLSKAYTRENIELWSSFNISSKSKVFQAFYQNPEKVDLAMGRKGYAEDIIDKTIQFEIVDSFFRMQKGETTTISGQKISNGEVMFIRLPQRRDGKIAPDYVEANWDNLQSMIREKFSAEDAERNVLQAKFRWYRKHQNMPAAIQISLFILEKYPPSPFDGGRATQINDLLWLAFLYVTDKELLKKAVKWMKKALDKKPKDDVLLDTYANLLYKVRRKKEAVKWEEKALSFTNPIDKGKLKTYRNIIEEMKEGKPTYEDQGAIWVKPN